MGMIYNNARQPKPLFENNIPNLIFINGSYHSFCWKRESQVQLITVHGGCWVRSLSCQPGIVDYHESAPIQDFASMHRIKMVSPKCRCPLGHDMATLEERRAASRAETARAVAGLSSGNGSGINVALDAMTRTAQATCDRAAALDMKAKALSGAKTVE